MEREEWAAVIVISIQSQFAEEYSGSVAGSPLGRGWGYVRFELLF